MLAIDIGDTVSDVYVLLAVEVILRLHYPHPAAIVEHVGCRYPAYLLDEVRLGDIGKEGPYFRRCGGGVIAIPVRGDDEQSIQ